MRISPRFQVLVGKALTLSFSLARRKRSQASSARDDTSRVGQFRYFRDKVVMRDHLAATDTLTLVGQLYQWAYGPFSGVDTETEKHFV
ncbi:hypothetical protein FB45DRAFT_934220 [Roridomyces roridus]|uniref:Uncharacterized protein n=1 Tax=Roridomyces roridus TaxID=1738132 RepID=A0AAD7BC88_9AGAR|nr:hypothetical protein FB45DRAFT_934220 [Roridomyces roridus]